MRKGIALIIAFVAAMTLSLFMAGGAEAASNGDHDQEFTCTTPSTSGGAGTTVTTVFSYHTTGIGSGAGQNRIYPDKWVGSTSPAAQLDYASISLGDNSSSGTSAFKVYGIGSAQNDVASSWSTTSFDRTYIAWSDGEPGAIRMSAHGGVSNGTGQCSRVRNSL